MVKPTVFSSAGNGSTIGASIASQDATSITFNMNTLGSSYSSGRGNMAALEFPYGKYYFEAVRTGTGNNDMFTMTNRDWSTQPTGLNNQSASYGWLYNTSPSAYPYYYTNDLGFNYTGPSTYARHWNVTNTAAEPNRIGIAYDSANNRWWVRLGGSVWMWGDPAAGTGAYNSSTAGSFNSTSHKFFLGTGNGGSVPENHPFRIEGQPLHQYSTPTGFTAI